MSITINRQQQRIQSPYRPTVVEATSSNYGTATNYRMVAKLQARRVGDPWQPGNAFFFAFMPSDHGHPDSTSTITEIRGTIDGEVVFHINPQGLPILETLYQTDPDERLQYIVDKINDTGLLEVLGVEEFTNQSGIRVQLANSDGAADNDKQLVVEWSYWQDQGTLNQLGTTVTTYNNFREGVGEQPFETKVSKSQTHPFTGEKFRFNFDNILASCLTEDWV